MQIISVTLIKKITVWSDKYTVCSILLWSAVYIVHCLVSSVQVQVQVWVQVQVQCAVFRILLSNSARWYQLWLATEQGVCFCKHSKLTLELPFFSKKTNQNGPHRCDPVCLAIKLGIALTISMNTITKLYTLFKRGVHAWWLHSLHCAPEWSHLTQKWSHSA